MLVPSIGSVLNFSPRAPGPTQIHAWPYSDSQRVSVFWPKVTKNFSTSHVAPSAPPPCPQLLVSRGAALRGSGRPGEGGREDRWAPRVQAAAQEAPLGISQGPEGACLQDSGPTFQSGHYNAQRDFSILLKSEPFLNSPQFGHPQKSGHLLPSPSLSPLLVCKNKCPAQLQKGLEATGSWLPVCPTSQDRRLRGQAFSVRMGSRVEDSGTTPRHRSYQGGNHECTHTHGNIPSHQHT